MPIKDRTLAHWIDHFYGYGSWDARFWFIKYEEGGGDTPEEVAEKLDYFDEAYGSSGQPSLCDIRALYRHVAFRVEGPKAALFKDLYQYRFDKHAIQHGVWKNLVAFHHGYRNIALPDVLEYQRSDFASQSLKYEALIRLYPLPAPHNHAWYYSWLDMPQFPFLKSRKLYQEHLYPTRIHTILQKIREHKPEAVLMYGMENINTLKKSVQHFFPDVAFSMVKARKQETPQHHRAEINGTVILITTQVPALRHNRIETGFDWYEFGRSAGVNKSA